MSIGLAMSRIAKYTAMSLEYTNKIAMEENQLFKAEILKDPNKHLAINMKLNIYKTILRMCQDFLEFWKEVLKNFLGQLKLFNDLIRQ